MKEAQDQTFFFRFIFLESTGEKGFVTHYRPKHPPLSEEMESVFRYLGLRTFDDCPEFDFEQCHYRTLRFESRGSGIFDSNTEFAHRGFDAHATRFSPGIEKLLAANAATEEVGYVIPADCEAKGQIRSFHSFTYFTSGCASHANKRGESKSENSVARLF